MSLSGLEMHILMRYSLPCSQVFVFDLQEYLEMQRQLAIQRLQEQEKERQMRLEQQKHTIQMRAQMPAFSLPYAQVHTAYSGETNTVHSAVHFILLVRF